MPGASSLAFKLKKRNSFTVLKDSLLIITSLENSTFQVFGEIDNDLYKGDMLYTPIVKKWYYEVIITDISVNGLSLGVNCKKYNYDKTIIDSGTTNLRVPEDVFYLILAKLKKYDKVCEVFCLSLYDSVFYIQ